MTAILLDFFGTLVTYSPSRTEQGFHRSHAALAAMGGAELPYEAWLTTWAVTSARLDTDADRTGVEFSMHDAFDAFAAEVELGPCHPTDVDRFIETYLAEWSTAVRLIDGVPALLTRLRAQGHNLVLVTNTHHAAMVHGHLRAMGIDACFDAVITSIEVGCRKPRPEIFDAALAAVEACPGEAVFVGDSYGPDYLGPTGVGIEAYLVRGGAEPPDDVPAANLLASVLDLERVLGP